MSFWIHLYRLLGLLPWRSLMWGFFFSAVLQNVIWVTCVVFQIGGRPDRPFNDIMRSSPNGTNWLQRYQFGLLLLALSGLSVSALGYAVFRS